MAINEDICAKYFAKEISKDVACAALYENNHKLARRKNYQDIESIEGILFEVIHKTIDLYDPSKSKFITYLWNRLASRVQQERQYKMSLVHIPVNQKKNFAKDLTLPYFEEEHLGQIDWETWLSFQIEELKNKEELPVNLLLRLKIMELTLKRVQPAIMAQCLRMEISVLKEFLKEIFAEYKVTHSMDGIRGFCPQEVTACSKHIVTDPKDFLSEEDL